jgi:hypothetical protein
LPLEKREKASPVFSCGYGLVYGLYDVPFIYVFMDNYFIHFWGLFFAFYKARDELILWISGSGREA